MVYEKQVYYFSRNKISGKTKNNMGGRPLERHITDPRITRVEEMSRRERRMKESCEGGQGPEWAVVS
jgi:hypothetical protein